ncbi:hypothetical protein H072_8462 [Dactylellina haptotyla CBS 200.50]|uniref:Heterokaryon incompatibility domain-containing protein n=1 Tax=Dactylellina haptotyla (strain CBS 200.50) TaxID=1284197 RepID=S8BET6_DACHA|nr:hypothetical protein H072_8462 [Dactylellina haptotyla CBS 200.50]
MDIPIPTFKPYPHKTEVPCLCTYDYDGGDFATYPERKGFDKYQLLVGNFGEHPKDKTVAFLQSWLFFGLFSDVRKQKLSISEVTTTNPDGQLIIDSNKIPPLIEKWIHSISARHTDRPEAILSEAQAVIEYLCPPLVAWQTKYGAKGKTPREIAETITSPVPPAIACSIALLAVGLETALTQQFPMQPYVRFSRPASDVYGIPSLVIQRFLAAGWCISDVARLSRTYSTPTLYFASSFRRELPSPDFHEHCDLFACSASQVDDTTYVTKHVDGTCGCDHMFSALDDVRGILDGGFIPATIVQGDIAAGGKAWLEAVPFEKCKAVALSHVWSDGLGNVSANSIPECQVRRLKGLVDKLYGEPEKGSLSKLFKRNKQSKPVGMWLDTLCIPLEKEYRKLAIKRMVDTYAKSDKVLMIDAEFTQISMADIPPRELLVRISGSNWMRRMWTLQEAALNVENLYVQFADGVFEYHKQAVSLSRAWERRKWAYEALDIDIGSHNNEFATLHEAGSKSVWDWRAGYEGVGLALSGFAGRNTTKQGDLYLCLAGMMGLDVGEIHNTPDNERTGKMLSMVERYPKSIIFSTGPKLDVPRYGWACETFWKSKILGSAYRDAMDPATMKEEGLRLEYQGYTIKPFKLPDSHFILNTKGQGYWIKVTYDPADPASIRDKIARTGHDESSMQLGLILPHRDLARTGPGAGCLALLVSIDKVNGFKESFKDIDNQGAIYSKALCTVLLTNATDSERQQYLDDGNEIAHGKKPNESQGSNSMVYYKQIWFIG